MIYKHDISTTHKENSSCSTYDSEFYGATQHVVYIEFSSLLLYVLKRDLFVHRDDSLTS